jgi:cytochrome c biogenesis protein CcmG/thiol:disulfide interchange protein DsbE
LTSGPASAAPAAARSGVNRVVLIAGLLVVLPLLALLILNLGRDPHLVASPLVGRPAPPFSLAPLDGGAPVSLQGLAGRPAVINFWATWCIPCLDEHPVLVEAARTSQGDAHYLGIVYEDDEDRVRAFLRQRGAAYPSLLDPDGKTAIAYGIFGVPETFFLDAQGRIAAKHVGPLTRESLAANLAKASGSTP